MVVWLEPRIPRSAIISPKQPSRFPSIEKGPRRASYQHIERLLPESLAFYLQGSAQHEHTENLEAVKQVVAIVLGEQQWYILSRSYRIG